jgi:hypothetical protein
VTASTARPQLAGAAERREKAFDLRIAGNSYRQIGKELGVSHEAARGYVIAALEESAARTDLKADQLRDIELARIDEVLRGLWSSKDEPQTASVIIRLGERRSKLLGLDAPTKLEHMLEPGQVQTVLGFAVSGALQLVAQIREAFVAGELTVEMIDDGQGVFVQEFEQRSRSELQPGSEAA